MTVYVLTSNYIDVDSGDVNNQVIGVYQDIEVAQQEMKEQIKFAKQDFDGCDYEESDFVEGDMSYEIWEKEWSMAHRCEIKIQESEVL